MKRHSSDTIKAMSMDRSGSYLKTYGNTIEEVKKEIDEANARAVKLGYKAEQFMITCTEVYYYESDDGIFVKREIIEEAVEVYPPYLDNEVK